MQRPRRPETVTLDDVAIAQELSQRSPRPPNWQAEAQALHTLAQQMINTPDSVLQTVVDRVLDLCIASSAGVSLLETTSDGEEIFRARVLAGTLSQYVGGTTKRDFSPCGTCLDRGSPQLFSHPERYFTYLQESNTPIVEGLVLPLIADNRSLGTIWIMSHDSRRHFDGEDVRVMTSLADFTTAVLLLDERRQTKDLLAANTALEAEMVERLQAEEKLCFAQRRLELSLSGANLGVWSYNVGTDEFWADDRAGLLHGHEPHEVHNFEEAGANIHPQDRDRALAAFAQAIQDRSKLQIEYRVICKGGSVRWIASYAELIPSDRDEGIFYGMVQDISDRKFALSALHESQARSRALIENLPGGAAFVVDRDLRYLLAEGEALSAAGFKSEDLVGRTIFEVLPPQLAANYHVLYRQALAGEPFEYEHNAHDRSYISRGTPLRSLSGEVYAVLAVSYDISERKWAEEARRESEAKLAIELADAKQLQTISNQLIHEENINALYERILNAAIALMRSDMGSLQMLDSERQELRLLAWKGFHPDSAAHWERVTGESTSSCGGALRTGERLIVPDVNTADFLKGNDNLKHYKISGIVAMQSTPLISRDGRVVGMISTHWRKSHVPGDRELKMFDVLARQAADVLERKRAEEALRVSEAQLAADLAGMRRLYDLHARLSNETDLHAALEEILATACEFTNTVRGCVQLISDDGERLEMYAWRGYSDDSLFIEHFRYEGAKVACDMVRRHRERPIVEDVENFPPLAGSRDREVALAENIRATQSTPLVTRQGEMVGVLSNQFPQPHRPTDHELRLIDLLAWTAADFVARHRVEAALRESEARLALELADTKQLQNVSSQLIREDDVNALYEQIVDAAVALMRSEMGSLQMFHPERNELQLLAWKGLAPQSAAFWEWVSVDSKTTCGAVLNSGDRTIVPDVETCDFMADTEDLNFFRLSGIRAVQSTPLISRNGNMVGMFSTHWRDVHQPSERELRLLDVLARQAADLIEQRQAADALRESEEKYHTLFDSIDEGYCVIEMHVEPGESLDYRFIETNQAFEQQSTLVNAQGKWMRELKPNHEESWFEIYRDVALTGEPIRFEHGGRELEDRWFTLYAFRIGEPNKRQVAVLFNDITERKRAEQAKTVFFSNVSHEFRTPLTLLLSPLSDALSDCVNPLSPSQRERLELAHRNAVRLLKLVNTLLDFSRIEAGRMEAVYEPTDLATLTTELVSAFDSAIERSGLQLAIDCPPLPQPVYVDRSMWEKIVLNLLSNAFKFTFAGEITVRLTWASDSVELTVQDTGIGIKAAELPRLFKRFYQVRGARGRSFEGSGIGLSLVQELVKLHGGTIAVSSVEEEGSCFKLSIPTGVAHLPPQQIGSPQPGMTRY